MNPNISVIIPAHNEENYIRKTLHALKQQSYQNFETIVVTNGCTDKTEELVSKRVNDNLKLFKISQPNVSRARNHGASKAKGELLVFLDADTIPDKDFLKIINSNFSENHAMATTKVKPDQNDMKFKILMNLKNFSNKAGFYKGWISGALICRKKDFDDVNGYDYKRQVREHRNLILKLSNKGKYGCFNTSTTTSMRRFQSWGLIKTASFWLKQTFKDNFGDITKSEYEKLR